jgi:hypothetical protein
MKKERNKERKENNWCKQYRYEKAKNFPLPWRGKTKFGCHYGRNTT